MGINKVQYGNTVLIDLTDTTAVASDVLAGKCFYGKDGAKTLGTGSGGGGGSVTQDQDGYIVLPSTGGGSPSATQHTIYFEFTDSTDATINAWYDSSFISDAITATEPTTYGQKTVDSASLDGVTWYTRPTTQWETIWDSPVIAYENQATIPSLSDFYFSEGETWRITLDGIEYILTTEYYQQAQGYILGNSDLITDITAETQPPFVMFNVGWGALYVQIHNGGTGVTHPLKMERQISA